MEIELEKSTFMSNSNIIEENKYVRISKKLRSKYNAQLYSFINMETVNNNFISLQVLPAYTEDVETNENAVFVTEETYAILRKELEATTLKTIDTLTLGCDPEALLLRKNNLVVKASSFFKKHGEVGNDGHVLEFRPPPTTSEELLRDALYQLIKKARYMINDAVPKPEEVKLCGFSYKKGITPEDLPFYTTGFHLHFGIPPKLIDPQTLRIKLLIDQVVKILDYYVGVPSIILEENEDALRRSTMTIQYGKPGNYRLNFPTLEYRVPGGFNLRHPVLTCGLIGLGAVVVEDVLTRIKHCTDGFENLIEIQTADDIRELYPNLPTTEEIFKLILSPSTERARSYLDKIYKDISTMITFNKRQKSIVEYFNLIDGTHKINSDIEDNWETYYGSAVRKN